MNKKLAYIYNIIFLLTIILIPVSYLIFGKYLTKDNNENRNFTTIEDVKASNIDNLSSNLSSYVDDNFPYRTQFVYANGLLEYKGFSEASSENVIVGKNDFLFFKGENSNALLQYKGVMKFSQEDLERIADNLNRLKTEAENVGAEFVVFVAPNKMHVYKEFMPDYINTSNGDEITYQVIDFLEANTDIKIVYCYDALMAAKEKYKNTDLYFKQDTHWNDFGGYIGTKDLLKEFGIELKEVTEDEIEKTDYSPNDLANQMGIKNYLIDRDADYKIKGFKNEYSIINEEIDGLIEYENTGRDSRRFMMVRDSFALYMRDYIADKFNYCYLQHKNTFKLSEVSEVKPDILVYEIVERRWDDLVNYSIK